MPRASRPTNGPANPRGCLGRRGIPGATSGAGSCLASPPGTRARKVALRRWMDVRGMPRSTPAHGWTAVRDHGRDRAASPGSLAARPTPPPPAAPPSLVRLPSDGADALPDGDQFSEDEDFPPLLSDIPDLFVPIPRRGGPLGPPRPGRRATGQLEPD